MGVISFLQDVKVLYGAATAKPASSDTIGSLPLIVQQQAEKNPQAIALLCEEQVVTYQELNEQANRMAYKMQQSGIVRGDCVRSSIHQIFVLKNEDAIWMVTS